MPVLIPCHLCGATRNLREFDPLPGRAAEDARWDHCNRHDDADGCGIIHAWTGTPLCGDVDEETGDGPCLLDARHLGDHHGLGAAWPQV